MQQARNIFRVFIASPSDVADEREALRAIVHQMNSVFSKETGWGVELLGWEDTLPGHGRPQALINADLDKADLFIGCLWQRWGSPSGSGTRTGFEEEFDRAMERFEETRTPEVWLFFKTVDSMAIANSDEQLKKVLEFRAQLIKSKRLLFHDFDTTIAWKDLISQFLQRTLLRLAKAEPLGPGLGASAVVDRGWMRYLDVPGGMTGAENLKIHFDGGSLLRRSEGGLELVLRPSHSYPAMTAFQDVIARVLVLITTSDMLSCNPDKPTVFSCGIERPIPAGTLIPDPVQLNQAAPLPNSFVLRAEAILHAYLDGSTLRGTIQAGTVGGPRTVRTEIELQLR